MSFIPHVFNDQTSHHLFVQQHLYARQLVIMLTILKIPSSIGKKHETKKILNRSTDSYGCSEDLAMEYSMIDV